MAITNDDRPLARPDDAGGRFLEIGIGKGVPDKTATRNDQPSEVVLMDHGSHGALQRTVLLEEAIGQNDIDVPERNSDGGGVVPVAA